MENGKVLINFENNFQFMALLIINEIDIDFDGSFSIWKAKTFRASMNANNSQQKMGER